MLKLKRRYIITNLEKIEKRCLFLTEQITALQTQVKGLPKGKLICSKNGNRYKWYKSIKGKPIYIKKNQRSIAEDLAAKWDFEREIEELELELSHLKQCRDKFIKLQSDYRMKHANHPEFLHLLSSFHNRQLIRNEAWIKESYDTNPNHLEHLIHNCQAGHKVRSKSEVIIANTLFKYHIPYRYECKCEIGGVIVYPDFIILNPKTGEITYWEHFGMMDVPEYQRKAYSKLTLYGKENIIPNINLITTYETNDHPIDSGEIEEIVRKYFCCD